MAERIVNYFGTFLESMKSAAQRPADQPDALDAVLKALRDGPRPARELIPFTGNSAGEFVKVRDRLVDLGWARRGDGDALELTPEGREVAALLA